MTGGRARCSRGGPCWPGTAVTRSRSSPRVAVQLSQMFSAVTPVNPHFRSRRSAGPVVAIGTLGGSCARARRSKWSPCRWESTTASIAVRSSGIAIGSVRRRLDRPYPRYARSPRCRKLGSVSTVKLPSRSTVVAVPTKVRDDAGPGSSEASMFAVIPSATRWCAFRPPFTTGRVPPPGKDDPAPIDLHPRRSAAVGRVAVRRADRLGLG